MYRHYHHHSFLICCRCSVKNVSLCLGYWGVLDFNREEWIRTPLPNWPGVYSGLVNRGILLSNWISWEVHLFWIYFLHQITRTPGRMNMFSSLVNWLGKKNSFFWEKVNQCPQYGHLAEKNIFLQNISQRLLVTLRKAIYIWS